MGYVELTTVMLKGAGTKGTLYFARVGLGWVDRCCEFVLEDFNDSC